MSHPSDESWYHGTDASVLDQIAGHQKADFRGIQKHGPGFYITPNHDHAEQYAETHSRPAIQSGWPVADSPVEVSHNALVHMGQQFKGKYPERTGLQSLPDAHAGNIYLRTKGHDFMRVTANEYGNPIDVGVVLRPHSWVPETDEYL